MERLRRYVAVDSASDQNPFCNSKSANIDLMISISVLLMRSELHFIEVFSEQSVHVVYLAFSGIARIPPLSVLSTLTFIPLDFSAIDFQSVSFSKTSLLCFNV